MNKKVGGFFVFPQERSDKERWQTPEIFEEKFYFVKKK